MKKVIDGAQYNTDTARFIGGRSNGNAPTDLDSCRESLYQTKAGKYFLHGEGGARSKYSRSIGNNTWAGGEHIEPLTPSAAREWAEANLSGEDYIAEFGAPDEAADDKTSIGLSILVSTKFKLEKMRAETGKSISQIIDETFAG